MMNKLVWFRRDLRIVSNEALTEAINAGAHKAIYIFSKKQFELHHTSSIQIDLILRRLAYLREKLHLYSIELDIVEIDRYDQIPQFLLSYCNTHRIDEIYATVEYEINEKLRDRHCIESGVQLKLFDQDTILIPGTVLNGAGEMYRVFSAFKREWLKVFQMQFTAPVTLRNYEIDDAAIFSKSDTISGKWPVDDPSLWSIIGNFVDNKLHTYNTFRDIPGVKGTSGLSPYLALGMISIHDLLAKVIREYPHILNNPKDPLFSWVNELVWRDFYKHLTVAFPNVIKWKNFNGKYDHIQWRNDPEEFHKWCRGETGYPIVDAAIKQLLKTGWMHNRLRMIVASFLTKDLLVDWRLGETFFMKHLIDGDPAANNGGWQWAAGTGCDAQPWFRIFNPITQSQKFDPHGEFIRKWLPELKSVPNKEIHFPHKYLQEHPEIEYPAPIVDHKVARERALAHFKSAFN